MINSKWIYMNSGDVCPQFRKTFRAGPGTHGLLQATALGIYEVYLNGQRVGDQMFAPGWTNYRARLQVQEYDITPYLAEENAITVTLAPGWFRGRIARSHYDMLAEGTRFLARLKLTDPDGNIRILSTNESWECAESPIRFSDIYDGEIYDAGFTPERWYPCEVDHLPKNTLIPQEGPPVTAFEQLKPAAMLVTPTGERVIDFGQEITGIVRFRVCAKAGDLVQISHAEVLDAHGNFYTENLRSAKARLTYICRDGEQVYQPHHTFMGFRYIRLDSFPGDPKPEDFTAIVLHSRMERTGYIRTSDPLLNRLYENVIWGQKGNFLELPTDCPQRDERFGWLGDAQVFIRTAARNFDVKSVFNKWLRDMATEQRQDGAVPHVVPVVGIGGWEWENKNFCSGAAWADAAVICPWELYMAYGDRELLSTHLPMMRKWVEFMRHWGDHECLFEGHFTYGDWLAMDGPEGSYHGISDNDLLSTAYYAYCTGLLVKALDALEQDSSEYRQLYDGIVGAFQQRYPHYRTQTECAVALHFGLARDPKATAARLAELVRGNGCRLTTGFVGTPYLLHALSENGCTDLAYTLLLQQEAPSWLFSVNMGATTIWEHWNGRKADGSFWSKDMNSFNHYAYGAVADWMYSVPGGIRLDHPGYANLVLQPVADPRIEWFEASVNSPFGTIRCSWRHCRADTVYTFDTPVEAAIILPGLKQTVAPGHYEFRIPC